MSSRVMICMILLIASIVPWITMAKEIVVGDDAGWTLNFNYKAWAKTEDFRIGDTLVFRYPPGVHNVLKVNGTGFDYCVKYPVIQTLSSGYDRVYLATPGKKWYICGIAKHCEKGLRLAIRVKRARNTYPPYNH